jgi:translation initiation factor IF-2
MEDGESITDLDQLMSAISAEKDKFLRLVVRADVHGSAEALEECLLAIGSKKIKLEIIDVDVGSISKNDIELAATAGATVVGFNTKFESGVQALAKNQRVPIIQHNIIYEIVDQVRDAMANLLDPELHEQKLGAAEVRRIFSLKSETIAGCMVTEGKILRDQFTRVIRKKTVIFQGKFSSIKHLKEDLVEVRAGFECGIKVAGFDQFEVDDIIECFEIKKIQPAL